MMWSAAQTGHASSIGTSDSGKEQCLKNTASGVELPIWMFLSRFWPAPQHVVEHCHTGDNFVMPGVIVGAFFLECSTQSHQLCSVESPSNGLVRFEQLIIHQADHQIHNMSFFPWIFDLAVDVEVWSPWFPFFGISLVSCIMSCSNRTRPLLGPSTEHNWWDWAEHKEKRAHYYSRHDKIILLHDNVRPLKLRRRSKPT